MTNNTQIVEFTVLGRLRIDSLRINGERYKHMKRINVEFDGKFFTLDIIEPDTGLSTSNYWTDCLARYWSIQNEVQIGEFYRLCDGPNNYIGEMELLRAI